MRSGLAAAALLLPALVACGGEKPRAAGPPPSEAVTRAAARTAEARTARVSLRLEGVPGSGETTGLVDMAARTADVTLRVVTGRVVEIRMLVLDRTGYAKTSVHDHEWHEVDLSDRPGESGFVQGLPTTPLAFVAGASGDVREAGSGEEVRGEETTRYDATFDLARAAEAAADARLASDVRGVASYARATSVPGSVWVDGDGRVRRVRVTFDGSKIGDGELRGDVTMTLELWDFGLAVDVQRPPAHLVLEASRAP